MCVCVCTTIKRVIGMSEREVVLEKRGRGRETDERVAGRR